MNNLDGPSTESMEEDYEYINSAPNYSELFNVAHVGRYKLVGDRGCDIKISKNKKCDHVIHDFEINIENIGIFFNRIHSRNHNVNLKNTESWLLIASAFETSINSTDREILIAQTDILDRELRKCTSGVYWARNQNNLMRVICDTIIEFSVTKKENIKSEEIIQNDSFNMNSLSEVLDQAEAPKKQFDIYKIIASLNKKK
ncbi:hypothetical protein C2G38_2213208 [Gigaspora rosea]|uniref:Uncharacterized protein n=1 Tax=Gigaspora rosea TaxID=44941 RepID=A0A397UCD9_9GLOM|nr:hypothetical protein C2G38_2213208 [Gigaspora rosea]